jgi:hypothetical protein
MADILEIGFQANGNIKSSVDMLLSVLTVLDYSLIFLRYRRHARPCRDPGWDSERIGISGIVRNHSVEPCPRISFQGGPGGVKPLPYDDFI